MAKLDFNQIASTIKNQIKEYQTHAEFHYVGTVISVADGVVICYGLTKSKLGQMVEFENGTKGLIFNIEQYQTGILLFGDVKNVKQGDSVQALDEILQVPVGEALLGRVVNPFGEPIDQLGAIKTEHKLPIERNAWALMDRQSVNEPLETGILVIDALVPIGKGQRELIIGDRQTGKTTIALDIILNQKGKNVFCVYVAIGKKEASIANLVQILKNNDALNYTVVVCASAADLGAIQYLAPYSGSSIAEYFMENGHDCLIVYDDLSKHATAYREISLLLKRPSGREAYPGDVFYLHSRLLERAGRLANVHGGGSITALPIVETQASDISAYIPTNIISITDGQIYLENKLFYSGIRPAINAGLSVSRVGGSAQTRAMKKVTGTLRLALASYKELEAFTHFGSDLDEYSLKKLDRGQKTIELLKQNEHELVPLSAQVVMFYALDRGILDNLNIIDIPKFKTSVINNIGITQNGLKIIALIKETKQLPSGDLLKEFLNEVFGMLK